ncbi:MAG TPA: FAD:protein FMN transferase [Acidimicrobiales bacterium]|nr:FAD:protein FMN transferase [Acidimicrobiales bacterium]
MTVTWSEARTLHEQRRRAMGSDAQVLVVAEPDADPLEVADLVADAWARIEVLEGRWSRFRSDSEVSVLNRAVGAPVVVSADTFTLVAHAIAAWTLTAGRFDPTVGAALVALGYDRDFAEVNRSSLPLGDAGDGEPVPGPAGIELDPQRSTVTLPAGARFDPGGIGKGLASDLVADALLEAGALGALVNLGGDLRAAGDAPDPEGWPVSLPDPLRPGHELARFSLRDGAVATSSRLHRQWRTATGPAHHLIDPTTGRSSTGDTVAVTVVADRAWRAEALTKALFLDGPHALDAHPDVHALVVTADGRRHADPALQATLR